MSRWTGIHGPDLPDDAFKPAMGRMRLHGGGGGQTTTTTKADPWVGQQPYLQSVFGGAQNAYNNYAANPSASVAGFTPMQQQAMGITQNVANGTNFGYSPALNNATANYTTNLANGAYLNANPANSQLSGLGNNGTGNASLSNFASGGMMSNPYETGALNAANNAITRSYQTATAPQTASAFEAAGRYGSGAYGNAVSQNQQDLATQLGNTDASLVNNIYQQNMGNMLSAAGTQSGQQLGALSGLSGNYNTASQQQLAGSMNAPNVVNSINSAATNLYNMGGNQQSLNQAQINAPWQLLNNYSNLIQGQYGGQSSTSQPYYQNQLAGGLGGALGGAATGAMLGSAVPGIGNVAGAIGGGLVGGLGGIFSDRRLKLDIVPTGAHLDNGLPIYSYRYLWDEPNVRRVGVMADEVRHVIPHAVHVDPATGFDKVDYAAIGATHHAR